MKIELTTPFHVSVACVCLGFDGTSFHVLIANRTVKKEDGTIEERLALPGGVVGMQEDLEDTAKRVFSMFSENRDTSLKQFKVFGQATRCTSNIVDRSELNHAFSGSNVDRLLCVAYVATVKISKEMEKEVKTIRSKWYPCHELPSLCFDHGDIVSESLFSLKKRLKSAPDFVYDLLDSEFTAAELRRLLEAIIGKKLDIRNFYKKVEARSYLVTTNKK